MTILLDWLSGSLAESLCLALLHSLWQGAALSALFLLVVRRIPDDRPQIRYAVSLVCLYGLLGGVCLTWSILRYPATTIPAWTPSVASAVDIGASEAIVAEPRLFLSAGDQDISTATAGTASRAFGLRIATFAPWCVSAWILGAGICLILSLRHVAAARPLRAGTPIEDLVTRRLLNRLISSLRISRPVQLLSVEGLAVPGVVGVLKPAILIPSSLLTGLTPDQWEAILAHELAHIRRWDYLVNLSQLVIESLLFFNPAVWWLSRQVNLEREACCDASAVGLTARPVQYAALLVDLAERLHLNSGTAVPAVGFSRGQSGSLMERVRRIVTPGRRSELTIKRSAAISFLVLGLIAVGLLQAGADVAVVVAADMLSDEQRVETLVESAKNVDGAAIGLRGAEEKLTIRGTVEVEGDELPKQPVVIRSRTRRGTHTMGANLGTVALAENPDFEVTVEPGISWLNLIHLDYAETIVGPYGPNDGPLVTGVRIVFTRGLDVSVAVVEENGSPVPEARISAVPAISGSTYRKAPTTDKNGQAVLKHINPELEYSLWVTAPGFQALNPPRQKFEADSASRFEMLRAKPVTGFILDQRGDAVADAKVKQIRRRRPRATDNTGGRLLTVSDTEGHFQLRELEDGWTHDLLIEADGCAPTVVPNVSPGDEGIRVELRPALTVKGTIRGSHEQLEQLKKQRAIVWRLRFPQQWGDPSLERLEVRDRLTFEIVDGAGKFTLPPMAPGELSLEIGGSFVRQELTGSIEDLRIDLSEDGKPASPDSLAKRPIRITFTRDGEKVSPRGTLQIFNRRLDERHKEQSSCPIEKGVVETQVYAPDRLSFDCREMIGFWFGSHDPTAEIAAGEETLEIAIPVLPAGAVKGVILNADGTPADAANVSVMYELSYNYDNTIHPVRSYGGAGASLRTNQKGEFFISPIPFGAKCSIRVSRGKYIAVGDKFTMSAENALPSFAIKFGRAVDAKVRLLDPSGAPLVGQPVELNCRHPLASTTWGTPEITDKQGECRFGQLNPDLKGHYVVKLDFTKDYVSTSFPLKLNGETTVFRVQRRK